MNNWWMWLLGFGTGIEVAVIFLVFSLMTTPRYMRWLLEATTAWQAMLERLANE